MKRVVHIGLPELTEEKLIEVGELAQEAVIDYIFKYLTRSEVKDIEVTARINREDTLDLELEVYLEVPIFVKVDVDTLVDEAIENAYKKVEKRLMEIAGENKAQKISK
ncbi:DUF3194 domain-containing protein [Thermococcus argininiproducens]|uniref:DUF3194 domain-containing protein n=1 Tax=Thermococcus argininiproducens TaxID=2866384 RepID=A0A9E7SD61_9EURY|nr:DUF3194 domain-containing protein [Thermococcus argininiproducens]USG99772.1 DUF3194 domain-containing protein [Thermococcus argininiproducens]